MFVLKTTTGFVYTGKAGAAWVSTLWNAAFTYASHAEATRKAALFNRMTGLHGLTFTVAGA